MPDKAPSRFREWQTKVANRLARSGHVFLLGVIVACGIEVLNDWNSTLLEINQLRSSVRQKALNYVAILSKPLGAAVEHADATEQTRLTEGLFDDQDAVIVRVCDAKGKTIYERVRDDYKPELAPHKQLYDHLMERDIAGMLKDPAAYKARVAKSRYSDFAQVWTDATARAAAFVSTPPKAPQYDLVLYQDRLRDENHKQNDRISWSVGVLRADEANVGALLVAFDMRKTHAAVRAKYLKGFGVIAFFVALIVVQNVFSRRDKLRLLDLQTRYASAKKALMDAVPSAPLEWNALRASGALQQAKGPVDGLVWDAIATKDQMIVLAADPDGDGIDAAAVGLHVLKSFRKLFAAPKTPDLTEAVRALGAATDEIPLTRPIGIAIVAIDMTGVWDARTTAFASLRVLQGTDIVLPEAIDATAPAGIVGPIRASKGTLAPGASLVVLCAGLGEKEATIEADALARYLQRAHAENVALPVDDAATWARGRSPALAENDIAVLAISSTTPLG